jgi:hypothetical protein
MARRRASTRTGTPHWFELYNPRGGVPRESVPGYRRASEHAAVIFDRALALLDEPSSEIDLASALAVLGSTDDEGEYDYDEASAVASELPFLVGAIDWTPEEVGDLLVAVMDTYSRGGIIPDDRGPGAHRRSDLGHGTAPRAAQHRQGAGLRFCRTSSLPAALLQPPRNDVRHRCILAFGFGDTAVGWSPLRPLARQPAGGAPEAPVRSTASWSLRGSPRCPAWYAAGSTRANGTRERELCPGVTADRSSPHERAARVRGLPIRHLQRRRRARDNLPRPRRQGPSPSGDHSGQTSQGRYRERSRGWTRSCGKQVPQLAPLTGACCRPNVAQELSARSRHITNNVNRLPG